MSLAAESTTENPETIVGEKTLPTPLRWMRHLSGVIIPLLTLAILFLIWEWAVVFFKIPKFQIPAPSEMFARTWEWRERLPSITGVTLYNTLAGFGLAVVIGMPLAVLINASRILQNSIYPILLVFQSVPKIAIAPVLVFTMGLGDGPKIAVAFLISFFPIVVDTATGLESVDHELLDMVKSFQANGWQVFWRVKFPSALPYIFSGLKVAISLAVVGAVTGEFVASDNGLGNLILIATANANPGLAFGAMLLLAIMGIILFALIALLEKLVLWYK